MLWDAGVVASLAICAGIALDLLGRPVLPTTRWVGATALAGMLWAGGDLLLRHAQGPDQLLLARQVLFAGICAMGPCMLQTALRMQGREGWLRVLLVAAVAVEVVIYGTLFTSRADLFITGSPADPTRGPLFAVHALVQWCLVGTAIALVVSSSASMRGACRMRGTLVALGASFPILANLVYLAFGVPDLDPTPIAMGVGGISLRLGVPYLVGAPYLAAQARSELLDQVDAAIFVADGSGMVLETNRAAQDLCGSTNPIGAYLGDLIAPFAQDPGYDVRRFRLRRHGRRVGVGAIVNDRRSERVAEQRAEVAARMEALGVLTRGLAHEIDEPLSAVIGATDLLDDALREEIGGDLSSSRSARLLGMVEGGVRRASEVVRRMRQLSEAMEDSAPSRTAEVRRIAEYAVSLACLGKDRDRVVVSAPAAPVHAAVRPTDLLQILMHSVRHALESSTGIDPPVGVRIERDEALVTVRILGPAPALPLGDLARTLRPSQNGSEPARSLAASLSLCWELARQNGGDLESHVREEGGSELRLVLPLDDLEERA